MVEIKILCPTCSKERYLKINEKEVKDNSRGIIALNISNDDICPHSFVTYLDKNLDIRDSFCTDFTVQIPEIPKEEIKESDFRKIEDFDTNIIKMYIYPNSLIYILKACFHKKKLLILNEEEYLKSLFTEFFNLIFKDSFNYEILIKSKNEYESEKKIYKKYIILEENKVLKDKHKVLEHKKIKIEKQIIQRFLANYDSRTSLIFLRNEIKKAFNLSKSIIEIVESLKEKEKININTIIGKLEHVYGVKISRDYLSFLIEIVENYFGVQVPIIYENILGFV